MEVCKYASPEWLEVEEGHFCACHLYDTDDAKARAAENMKKAKAEEAGKSSAPEKETVEAV